MARYIDVDALLQEIECTIADSGCVNHEREIMDCIHYAPTTDIIPVNRGKWLKTSTKVGWVECVCSICGGDAPAEYGRYTWIQSDYCPDCGARMDSAT